MIMTRHLGRWIRAQAYIVPSIAAIVLAFAWFVSYGTWNLLSGEPYFGDVHDAQAQSLLHGRLDIPLEVIRFEAFVREEDRGEIFPNTEALDAALAQPDPWQSQRQKYPDAKYYAYFGLGPALLRLPLLALFPELYGKLSQLMMAVACALSVVAASLLFQAAHRCLTAKPPHGASPHHRVGPSRSGVEDLRPVDTKGAQGADRTSPPAPGLDRKTKMAHTAFVLLVGLGSTNLYLAASACVYFEAVIWGAAFALFCYYFLLRYLETGRTLPLALASSFAFLSVLSRPTSGAGALFSLAVLVAAALVFARGWWTRRGGKVGARNQSWNLFALPRVPPVPAQVLLVILAGLTTVATYGMVNYLKFRAFGGPPLHSLLFVDKSMLERTGGQLVTPKNIRTVFVNAFGPTRFEWSDNFPWIGETHTGTTYPESKVDHFEGYIGAPVNMPALLALALIGMGAAFRPGSKLREFRLLIVGALFGGITLLMAAGLCTRYLHDFYPFLVVAGAAGLQRILVLRRPLLRWATYALLLLLVPWSIFVNGALAIAFQRDFFSPEKRKLQLQEWSGKADYLVKHQFLAPTSLAVGDLNGDHVPDLVAADPASERVRVLMGHGGGLFRFPQAISAGVTPRGVAVGDFNGDGVLDLAAADPQTDSVQVLLGNGHGTFMKAQAWPAGSEPRCLVVGQFNSDGKLDLAAAGDSGICLLRGQGDGTFQKPQGYVFEQPNLCSLAVGDFNGDGFLDLVVADGSQFWVLLGNGDGTFREAVHVAQYSFGVVVGDLNGDGHLDLAVGGVNGVWVFLGKGDGTFQDGSQIAAGWYDCLAVGDFNGDGHLDLAVGGPAGIAVLLGKGDGSFKEPLPVSEAPCRCLAVGDFNGDGHPDLAGGGWRGFQAFWGNGDGTFRSGPYTPRR